MDGSSHNSISPKSLYARIGTAAAPVVIDVRRAEAFEADDRLIVAALRRDPDGVGTWCRDFNRELEIIVYCAHGAEVSQSVATALRGAGLKARYLEGGIGEWAELGLPLRKKLEAGAYGWVTRERPKIDRIACPWMIRRFIDPSAAFLYVPTEQVFDVGKRTGATAYDIPGAEPFSHDGELCSFDLFLRLYDIRDPALNALAVIVRGADTSRPELAPQAPGLLALSLGLSANYADDHAMLEHGLIMYDAFYAWCRSVQDETHNWTPEARA